ncbi:HRDC domain-containing protein [uncultured Desulfobacter sp.]|uniref:HRDC domain-containing protein n=1 Tax=uncultured Desulfobacter sp. TaxID=240139 RepID=UPI002AABF8F4|nr:HRDC domain-containing protein [uncultured Desulfobacter sp.]
MKFKIFTYPVPPPEDPAELNSFLSSVRVLSVSQYKCRSGSSSCLVFVVEYLEGKPAGQKGKPQPRVDYRETLSDGDFTLFSRLRDLRKTIAEKEGVPVYAVFTNAQLSGIVEKRINDMPGLLALEGVGQAKADKYGQDFIRLCREIFPAPDPGGSAAP